MVFGLSWVGASCTDVGDAGGRGSAALRANPNVAAPLADELRRIERELRDREGCTDYAVLGNGTGICLARACPSGETWNWYHRRCVCDTGVRRDGAVVWGTSRTQVVECGYNRCEQHPTRYRGGPIFISYVGCCVTGWDATTFPGYYWCPPVSSSGGDFFTVRIGEDLCEAADCGYGVTYCERTFCNALAPSAPDGAPYAGPNNDGPPCRAGEDCREGQDQAGEPVELGGGTFFEDVPLLSRTVSGRTVTMKATYSTRTWGNQSRSELGRGWTLSYLSRHLFELDGDLYVWLGLGRYTDVMRFVPSGPGEWSYLGMSSEATARRLEDGTYVVRYRDGTEEAFGVDGFLTDVRDPEGRALSFRMTPEVGGRSQMIVSDADAGPIFVLDYARGALAGFDGEATPLRLVAMRDADAGTSARQVRFDYDADGQLVGVMDPNGDPLVFGYDAQGRVDRVWDRSEDAPSGRHLVNEYEDATSSRVLRQTMSNGAVLDFVWESSTDHDLRLVFSDGVESYEQRVRHDPMGRVVAITPQGMPDVWTVRDIDASTGVLRSTTDPSGRVTRYTYDPDTWDVTSIDDAGSVTGLEHDAQGRIVRVTHADGRATVLEREPERGLVIARVEVGTSGEELRWTYEYDERALVWSAVSPDGSRTCVEYDVQGAPTRVLLAADESCSASELGLEERWSHDAIGLPIRHVDAAGLETRYEYGDDGRPTRVVARDPSGDSRELRISYLPGGRISEVVVPGPAGEMRTRFEHDFVGSDESFEVVRSVDPTGRAVRVERDVLGRVTAAIEEGVSPGECRAVRVEYDVLGRRVRTIVAPGTDAERVVDRVHDAVGRLVREVLDPDGRALVTRYDYRLDGVDDAVHLLRRTDGSGQRTDWRYDAFGQLVRVFDAGDENTASDYEYDSLGRLTGIVDARERRVEMRYDLLGRLVSRTDPWGTEGRTYGATGQLASFTDIAGRTTRFEYDVLDRLTRTTHPDGATTTLSRLPNGLVAQVAESAGDVVDYQYDDANRPTRREVAGRGISYLYGADGEIENVVYDGLGPVRYERSAGEVTALVTWSDALRVEYGRSVAGDIASVVARAGVAALTTTYARVRGTGWLEGIESRIGEADGLVVDHVVYGEWDGAGRALRTETAGEFATTRVTTAAYDSRGRLAQLTDALGGIGPAVRSFDYDVTGNRTLVDGERARFDAQDRLEGAEYDRAGNLTFDGTTRFSYDARNRLVRSERPGLRVDYAYDPSGYLSRQTVDGEVTRFLVDDMSGLPRVMAALRANDETYFAWGPGGLTARQRVLAGAPQPIETPMTDRLGTVRGWVDPATGEVLERRELDAWGVPLNETALSGSGTSRTLTLRARRDYGPSRFVRDGRVFPDALEMTVPASLSVEAGNAGNHFARLDLGLTDGTTLHVCYRGGASQSHPTSPDQVELGRTYTFHRASFERIACDRPEEPFADAGDYRGAVVRAERAQLIVLNGSSRAGSTTVRAQLAIRQTEPTPGATAAIPRGDLGFTGEWQSPDGTVFLRARAYLPAIGRFLQRDRFEGTLESLDSHNRFAYVGNDPLSYVDPSGFSREGRPYIEGLARRLAGFGDNMSFGATGALRRLIGRGDDPFGDPNDPDYQRGDWAAGLAQLGLGLAGLKALGLGGAALRATQARAAAARSARPPTIPRRELPAGTNQGIGAPRVPYSTASDRTFIATPQGQLIEGPANWRGEAFDQIRGRTRTQFRADAGNNIHSGPHGDVDRLIQVHGGSGDNVAGGAGRRHHVSQLHWGAGDNVAGSLR